MKKGSRDSSRLPGIPHMLDSGAGGGGGKGGAYGLLRASAEAPHRARFVQDARALPSQGGGRRT